jgi:carbon-monoxide dehydrogenase small subunit
MRLTVNGKTRTVHAHPMKRLLDVLREDCGLTGTKEGCGEGECGACTVLIDGVAVDSCIVPLAHAEGRRVITIEGAAATKTGKAKKGASLPEIQTALAGNLCRCTGYPAIFRSVRSALKSPKGKAGRAGRR